MGGGQVLWLKKIMGKVEKKRKATGGQVSWLKEGEKVCKVMFEKFLPKIQDTSFTTFF